MAGRADWLKRNMTKQPLATRQFTDRVPLRESFHRMVDRCRAGESDVCVMNFYGVGGIGKSALLRQLKTEAEAAEKRRGNAHPAGVMINFDVVTPDAVQSLLAFRRALGRAESGMLFSNFDYALERLALTGDVRLQTEAAEDSPEKALLSDLTDIAGDSLPVVGALKTVAGVFGKLSKVVRKRKYLQPELTEMLATAQAEDIVRSLPLCLAMDVNQQLTGILYVFIDTYERLVADGEGETSRSAASGADAWLHGPRGLIRNLPDAVFVIAGREKLRWDEMDDFWRGRIECHLTEQLAEKDSSEFLRRCGVPQGLHGDLYRLTGGEPVYLDLCVDQYENLLSAGRTPQQITPSDFGVNTGVLVERHTRYVADDMKDALYLAAALQTWTRPAFFCAAEALGIAVQPLHYRRLTALSYVQQEEDGRCRMDHVISDVLRPKLPPEDCAKAAGAVAMLAAAQQDEWLLDAALRTGGSACTEEMRRTLMLFADSAVESRQLPKAMQRYREAWRMASALHGAASAQALEALDALMDATCLGDFCTEDRLWACRMRWERECLVHGAASSQALLLETELLRERAIAAGECGCMADELRALLARIPAGSEPARTRCLLALGQELLQGCEEQVRQALTLLAEAAAPNPMLQAQLLQLRGDLKVELAKHEAAAQLLSALLARLGGQPQEAAVLRALLIQLESGDGRLRHVPQDFHHQVRNRLALLPEPADASAADAAGEIVGMIRLLGRFGLSGAKLMAQRFYDGVPTLLTEPEAAMLDALGDAAQADYTRSKRLSGLPDEFAAYGQAMSEVLAILDETAEADVAKIPRQLLSLMKELADRQHVLPVDPRLPLGDQGLSETAREILAMIYCYYWMEDGEI